MDSSAFLFTETPTLKISWQFQDCAGVRRRRWDYVSFPKMNIWLQNYQMKAKMYDLKNILSYKSFPVEKPNRQSLEGFLGKKEK